MKMETITDFLVILLSVVSIVVAVIVVAKIFIPWLMRFMADRGWFWIRVGEISAVVVLKDKAVHKILISCNEDTKATQLVEMMVGEKRFKNFLQSFADAGEGRDGFLNWVYTSVGNKMFKFVPSGKLFWIGPPWLGYELYSWYEHSRDDYNPEVDPHYDLSLEEQTWDYNSRVKNADGVDFNSEWGVDTADPIQVTPKLTVTVEIMNPYLALFGVKYYQEAIEKEILAAWKSAVQELFYFSSQTSSKSTDEKTPADGENKNLQSSAQGRLNKALGFPEDSFANWPHLYKDSGVARMIYDVYGVWLKRVQITDIDPTDPSIRSSLQELLKAEIDATAVAKKAVGERNATKTKADGDSYATEKNGKASATVILEALKARATGLKKMAKDLSLSEGRKGELLLAADVLERVLKEANYTYMTGNPGDVSGWLSAIADRFDVGKNKDTAQSKAEETTPCEESGETQGEGK